MWYKQYFPIIIFVIITYFTFTQQRLYENHDMRPKDHWSKVYNRDNDYEFSFKDYGVVMRVRAKNRTICSGVLISQNLVITSFYCVLDTKAKYSVAPMYCNRRQCEEVPVLTPIYVDETVYSCGEIVMLLLARPGKDFQYFAKLPRYVYSGDLARYYTDCNIIYLEKEGPEIFQVVQVRDKIVTKQMFCDANSAETQCEFADCSHGSSMFTFTLNAEPEQCIEMRGSPLMCVDNGELLFVGLDTKGCNENRATSIMAFYRIDYVIHWIHKAATNFINLG